MKKLMVGLLAMGSFLITGCSYNNLKNAETKHSATTSSTSKKGEVIKKA
ncbi:hypothetical protein [Enterococcus sp. CSURQ0835]|nr:hypothetical protein [Enterococcus sp. CSURQ0835]